MKYEFIEIQPMSLFSIGSNDVIQVHLEITVQNSNI